MDPFTDTDAAACERARVSRDSRFDGRFFVGVRTTRIYCRPICPANLPKKENVCFFPSAAAASEAGFRPCLRCRPECAPGTPAWAGTSTTVERGLRLIANGALDQDNIERLAERLGVTGRHLRRLFAKHVGASPLAVAHTQRLHFAKRLIDQTALPMKDVAVAAGFGSVRRFNDAFRNSYGRSPRELRNGRKETSARQSLSLLLPYRHPYGWREILAFLHARAIPGVECVADGAYRRTVEAGSSRGIIDVRDVGGSLALTVHGIDTESLFGVAQRARSLFDVDAPIEDISGVLGRDRHLRRWLDNYPGLRVPGAWSGWEVAVRAILGQQVSVKAARTLASRLVEKYGACIDSDRAAGVPCRLFPTAARLQRARIESLGVVRTRAQAIRDLARAVLGGDVRFDATQSPEDFRAAFTAVRGIGNWTAEYVAMRALKDPDAFPAADLGLLRAFDDAAGRRLQPRDLEARAAGWRPWRAYAALLIWNSDGGGGG
jgi:AraC family transcriptional regulator of adaptative response / DNA-3-methyladenine glycosylase II